MPQGTIDIRHTPVLFCAVIDKAFLEILFGRRFSYRKIKTASMESKTETSWISRLRNLTQGCPNTISRCPYA